MAGAFSHMVAAEAAALLASNTQLGRVSNAVDRFPEWVQAGSVAPDYPYLDARVSTFGINEESVAWADKMHYIKTGETVKAGVGWLQKGGMDKDSESYKRSLAWFAGYLSHVVLDSSIHPVVRAIVGEYESNKLAHRRCEMYMDSYIFNYKNECDLVDAEMVNYLKAADEGGGLDVAIKDIWEHMLSSVHSDLFGESKPELDHWHGGYKTLLNFSDNRFFLIGKIAGERALSYLPLNKIPAERLEMYVEKAKLPANNKYIGQSTLHYKDIFKFGVDNIFAYWSNLEKAIETGGTLEILNWNLDTGTEKGDENGKATLWWS